MIETNKPFMVGIHSTLLYQDIYGVIRRCDTDQPISLSLAEGIRNNPDIINRKGTIITEDNPYDRLGNR